MSVRVRGTEVLCQGFIGVWGADAKRPPFTPRLHWQHWSAPLCFEAAIPRVYFHCFFMAILFCAALR